jgi:DnaJ-class molecular chaperone
MEILTGAGPRALRAILLLAMPKPQICSICKGKGTVKSQSGKKIKCRNCAGNGLIVNEKEPPPAVPPSED